ncbi:MFS transporter [Rhabdothermincola salaria]|uniref:MFS transporter n=1 Tax=Rhabdothermincola salaria TaxID=2903142 RepID=UPI001E290BA7|nr:MFS transporter [Rhabdothermincola salaria]MCD9622360.1 MFS transporter [Rhabdothermincola salaria]
MLDRRLPPDDASGDGAPEHQPGYTAEDVEDALVDGDRTVTGSPIRSALRNRQFRIVYVGSILSNTGNWMQNVVMAAFAYNLTGSAGYVGLVTFAQLGPQLLFSLVGGALADTFDRRKVIVVMAVWQMAFSVVLAVLAGRDDPSRVGLLIAVFLVGSGHALQNPTFASLLPNLVPRRDLSGAIALNSANMNVSRIIGPAIGGLLYAGVGAQWVFLLNAVTYVFIIVAMLRIRVPRLHRGSDEATGLRRVLEGFAVVRRDPVIRRAVATVTLFSFFSLTFLTQMPVIAEENFAIPAKSTAYGVLYAVFGVGALAGALSIGSVFANRPMERVLRWSLAGFAVFLAAYGLVRAAPLAYPIGLVLGFFYFAAVTSLSTLLQHRLDDRVRGRVLAVWMMAFGGTVPIGGLVAGWVVERTDVTVIVMVGAVVAAFLVWFADLRDPADRERATALS